MTSFVDYDLNYVVQISTDRGLHFCKLVYRVVHPWKLCVWQLCWKLYHLSHALNSFSVAVCRPCMIKAASILLTTYLNASILSLLCEGEVEV